MHLPLSTAAQLGISLLVVCGTFRLEGFFNYICGQSTDLRTRVRFVTCSMGGEPTRTLGMYICPHLMYRVSENNGWGIDCKSVENDNVHLNNNSQGLFGWDCLFFI